MEQFDWKKLINGIFNITDKVMWSKELSFFNLRKLIIIGIILGALWGWGYYKGHINNNIKLVIDEAVEFTIPVPDSNLALYKPKHSVELYWIDKTTKKIVGVVKVKDIPELAKKLRAFGFILEPIGVAGAGGSETNGGIEGGVGVSWFKYYLANVDSFLTNRGVYLGVSYRLEQIKLNNSSIGLAFGKGWNGGNRGIIYFRIRF